MSGGSTPIRCLAVWGATTALAGSIGGWLSTGAQAPAGVGFDAMLVSGCALVGIGCLGWLWLLVTLVVVDALRGRPARAGVPDAVRRAVLVACGLTLAGGLAVPAHADRAAPPPESPARHASVLVGLPLPDRTTSRSPWVAEVAEVVAVAGRPRPVHLVKPGDTLWGIAEDTLGPDASTAQAERRWREIYRANRAAVGADPDLIRPGQRLLLPSHR